MPLIGSDQWWLHSCAVIKTHTQTVTNTEDANACWVCYHPETDWLGLCRFQTWMEKTIWRLQYTRHPCQFYFLHSVSLEFRVRAKSWNPIWYFNHITIVDRVSAQAILLQSGHMMEPDSFFLVFGKIEVIHGPLTNHLQTWKNKFGLENLYVDSRF